MVERIRGRLTYANVMSTLAVFLALGGGVAWALANNSVRSKHIVDGQVKGVDVANDDTAGALSGQDVSNAGGGSLGTADVAEGSLFNDNSLTGGDVAESTLAKVPSASNADSLSGKTAAELEGARAWAFVTTSCTPFCTISRTKGVAYAVRIGTGRLCVGVNNISAADSVAVVSAGFVGGLTFAQWTPANVGCAAQEFEIHTRNGLEASNDVPFAIAIP